MNNLIDLMMNKLMDKFAHKITLVCKISCALITIILLQGCVGVTVVLVASGIGIATDERSLLSQLDDQAIELSASTKIAENEALNLQTNIQVISIYGTILMVGQAPSAHL